MTHFSGQC
jgi:hypothetical protein